MSSAVKLQSLKSFKNSAFCAFQILFSVPTPVPRSAHTNNLQSCHSSYGPPLHILIYAIFFAWEKAKQKGMWHQKILGYWWLSVINACSCCILSRTLRTGRKGYTSLITGPTHSLAEEQKVQLFLLMSETKRLFERTTLRAVGLPLTHILGGEGKQCYTLWYLWCLVVVTDHQQTSFGYYSSHPQRKLLWMLVVEERKENNVQEQMPPDSDNRVCDYKDRYTEKGNKISALIQSGHWK